MLIRFNHSYLDTLGPNQAWLIGLLAADGSVSPKGHISLGQSKEVGLRLITHVKQLLEHDGSIYESMTSSGNIFYNLYIPKSPMTQRLETFGITPRKTNTLHFPSKFPEELLSGFVRGYLDGDGCVGVYKNGGSKDYLKIGLFGTPQFVLELNEKVPVTGRTCGQKNGMQIWWNGRKAVSFGNWLFSDPTIYRSYKYDLFYAALPNEESKMKIKWEIKAQEIYALADLGVPPMKIAKILQIPFQTVYRKLHQRV